MYISYIYIIEVRIMDIIITNSSGEPIYMQIVTQIKQQIISGRLQAGEALPSMRNLAMQLRISVITTKRAYEELEREGFIESYTGRGSFVRAQNRELLREEQLRQTEELLRQAMDKAKLAGLSMEELLEMTEVLFKEESDGRL
jgi:GntR family transcriptional regulator